MRQLAACLLAVALLPVANAQSFGHGMYGHDNNSYVGEDPEKWKEDSDFEIPAFPDDANLLKVDIGPAATNDYFIDSASLAIGNDRIVRYVLVVKTSGGATNVSFEGINCRDLSWKHYASGRSDRTWSKTQARQSQWRPIQRKSANSHHTVLSRYFFCPQGVAVVTADEGRNALRLGKHPAVN